VPIPTGMCTYHLHNADPEAEHGRGNEVDTTASTFRKIPVQSILAEMEESEHEWSTSDIEYEAILDIASGDDH